MNKFIPLVKPIGPNVAIALRYLEASYRVHQFTNFGPLVTLFEERIAEKLNVSPSQVVAFSSATSALAASLATSGMFHARLPDLSFVATLSAAMQARMEVKVVDVDKDSWMISLPDELEPGTVNVPVLPFGLVDHDLLTKTNPYYQVVDAAASLGGNWELSRLYKKNTIVFSLHATKPLGAGEGGVAIFGDEEWAKDARKWSNFGLDEARDVNAIGVNGKMSEFQAAFCLSALESWHMESLQWSKANAHALKVSKECGFETLLDRQNGNISSYWIVRVPRSLKFKHNLVEELKKQGIGSRYWWKNSLAALAGQESGKNSTMFRLEFIGLPMHRELSLRDAERVVEAITHLTRSAKFGEF